MKAICSICNQEKEVCCDEGYTENSDGHITHFDPRCIECCHPIKPIIWDGKSVAGGTYLRYE